MIWMMINTLKMDRKILNSKEEDIVKKIKENVKRKMAGMFQIWMFLYILAASGTNAYATGFKGSIYETGTKRMMKDLLSVGQGVAAAVVLVLWLVWEIQKRMGEDTDEGRFTKKQKGAVIGLIIAETIGTLFGIIGGYYGISINS